MVVSIWDEQTDVAIGDPVYTADGARMGYVLAGDAEQLFIGDGRLLRRTFAVDLADLAEAAGHRVVLRLTSDEFEDALPA